MNGRSTTRHDRQIGRSNATLIGAVAVLVAGATAAALWWLGRPAQSDAPAAIEIAPPAPIREPTPPARTPAAPVADSAPVPSSPPPVPLPPLEASDPELSGALSGLIGGRPIEQLLRSDEIARRIVLTIDHLPRAELPLDRRAVQPLPGAFIASGTEDAPYLGDANYARYAAFATLVASLDTDRVVGLYQRYYPLLAEAYAEIAPPGTTLDSRVLEVIDHLIKAPEIATRTPLRQPNVLYEFADPSLEALSSGQKILIRMGPVNAAIVKSKLGELRASLTR